jgi:hypothetical protein
VNVRRALRGVLLVASLGLVLHFVLTEIPRIAPLHLLAADTPRPYLLPHPTISQGHMTETSTIGSR